MNWMSLGGEIVHSEKLGKNCGLFNFLREKLSGQIKDDTNGFAGLICKEAFIMDVAIIPKSFESTKNEVITELKRDNIHIAMLGSLFQRVCAKSSSTYVPFDVHSGNSHGIRMNVREFKGILKGMGLYNAHFRSINLQSVLHVYKLDTEAKGFTFDTFLQLLFEIACRRVKFEHMNLGTMKLLLEKIYHSKRFGVLKLLVPAGEWRQSSDVKELYWSFEKVMWRIFDKYANKGKCSYSSSASSVPSSGEEEAVLSYKNLIRLCEEFGLFEGSCVGEFEMKRVYLTLLGPKFVPKKRKKKKKKMYKKNSHRWRNSKINFDQFRNFLLRFAVFRYNRPSSVHFGSKLTELLTVLLQSVAGKYFEVFKWKMENDKIDLNEIPTPRIITVDPGMGTFEGDCVKIVGENFDERKKISARLRFLDNSSITFPVEELECDESSGIQFVRVVLPAVDEENFKSMENSQVKVEMREEENMFFVVRLVQRIDVEIEISNNGEQFSNPLSFGFEKEIMSFDLGHEITVNLQRMFSPVYFNREKWEFVEQHIRKLLPHFNYSESIDVLVLLDESEEDLVCFESFLLTLLTFCVNVVHGVHPLDFFILLIRQNQGLLREEAEEFDSKGDFVQETSVLKRFTRIFDVYRGALLVGRLSEDKTGGVKYVEFSKLYSNSIKKVLEFGENFEHIVTRCIFSGFDLLAPCRDKSTRYPIQRCWHVFVKGIKNHVAVVSDYPGNFCTLKWVPEFHELYSPNFSCCVYKKFLWDYMLHLFKTKKSSHAFVEELRKHKRIKKVLLNVY